MTDYYIFNDYLYNLAKPEIIQDMPNKYMPDLILKIFQKYLTELKLFDSYKRALHLEVLKDVLFTPVMNEN